MIRFLFFLFFSLIQIVQPSFEFKSSFPIKTSWFTTDVLGNIYTLDAGHIVKYNSSGQKIASYSNPYIGRIGFIETSDPLKTLVYFSDVNRILWIDSQLAELRSPVSLDELGIDRPEALCSSSKGGFWLVDGGTRKIKYIDKNLQTVVESFLPDSYESTEAGEGILLEKNERLYLQIQGKGIAIFDLFGNYLTLLPITPHANFQVDGGIVSYYYQGFITRFDAGKKQEKKIAVPVAKGALDLRIVKDYVYIHTQNTVEIYQIKYE